MTEEQQHTPTSVDAGVVAKPFNSAYRRHRVDDPITRAELEKSNLDFDHLVDSGFIVAAAVVDPASGEKGDK